MRLRILSLIAAAMLTDADANAQARCPEIRDQDLTEEWRYKPSESAPAAQLIGRPEGIVRSRSGYSFVLDTHTHRVIRLDPRGRFDGAFGRNGRGPGEMLTPVSLRTTAAGEVAVLDPAQSRIVFFSERGEHRRTLRLGITLTSARDFVVLPDGSIVISGIVAGSTRAIHRLAGDGTHRESFGSLRMDLTEPVLRQRYSDGVLAMLENGAIAYAQRTPFRLQVFRNGRPVLDRTDPRVVPDYVRQVARREGGGWRFQGRHPRLTSLLPIGDNCFLVAVQVPPSDPDAEMSDFRTKLFVLDGTGRVIFENRLNRFFWGTQAWRTASGTVLLGFGMDRDTEVIYPVQYRLRSPTSAATARAPTGSQK